MSTAPGHVADKTILITGAASGFGRVLAEKCLARGARVGACDVNGPALAGLTTDVGSPEALHTGDVDVVDLAAMRRFVADVVDRFGTVDVIVNNAGVMPLAFLADHAVAAEAWSRCIDINIKGVLNGISAVHDQMISQGRGHVVNVSSVFSNHPVAGAAVYGATKAAVNVFSEALRQESLGAIKVTNVRPTGVPGTGLASGVINGEAVDPVLGANRDQFYEKMASIFSENPPPELIDPDHIGYAALSPELLADQILHAIDQPWGVSISDVTVRATNDDYLI